jgi:ABC-type uncharacterized transport system auxiliary subunit
MIKCLSILAPLLLALAFVACDPGATITYINETEQPVDIYLGTSPKAFDASVPAHSEKKVLTIRQVWNDRVIARDEHGAIVSEQHVTWDELKAQHFRVVISATGVLPTGTPTPMRTSTRN